MTKSRAVDLEPIDRLEGKIKLLVAALDHLRSDQARIVEENQRLRKDVEALRGQLAGVEETGAELGALREERDQVRTRVAEMLAQLDALNL